MARIRHLAIVSENRERLVKFDTEAFGMNAVEGVGLAIYLTTATSISPSFRSGRPIERPSTGSPISTAIG